MSIYPRNTLSYEPFVYFIGWSHLDVFYIGCRYGKTVNAHPIQLWTTYFTSSDYVKEFREINGEPDIIRIEKTFKDKEVCIKYEVKLLTRMKVIKDCRFLNKSVGNGKFTATGPKSAATKLKMSIAAKNLPPKSAETREKISIGNKGKVMSEESKQNMRIAQANRPPISDETRLKMSISKKNMSDETRAKMGAVHKGRKRSPETCRKISEAYKQRPPWTNEMRQKMSDVHKGKPKSEETRHRMSESMKGVPKSNETKEKLSIASKNRPKATCPHCGKTADISNMRRWHFDNCKFLVINRIQEITN
jgi:hypothetical protein